MRLIDADALRNKFISWFPKDGEEWESGLHPLENLSVSALMEIDEAPTIEAVEVVHGRWENGTCPNCRQVDFSKPNYCPNCGAKMDGGNGDGKTD